MSDLDDADFEGMLALAEQITPTPAALKELENLDPSTPPYPRGLVLDLALKTQPVPKLLEDYGITVEEFKVLTQHPVFRHDMLEMRDKLKQEGFSFRVKAQAQAEMYLKEAWKMVHDASVPSNVRADLIKWTTKVAGLEPKQGAAEFAGAQLLPQLAEQLKNLPDGELELRVMQVVLRNAKEPVPQMVTLDA